MKKRDKSRVVMSAIVLLSPLALSACTGADYPNLDRSHTAAYAENADQVVGGIPDRGMF